MTRLLIVLIFVLLAGCNSSLKEEKNITNQTTSQELVMPKAELTDCGIVKNDYDTKIFNCFKDAYENCKPAKIIVDAENKVSRLEVLEEKESKCMLNYIIEKGSADLENKNLLCLMETSNIGIDKEAAVRIMLLPADMLILAKEGKCQGSLLNTSFVK